MAHIGVLSTDLTIRGNRLHELLLILFGGAQQPWIYLSSIPIQRGANKPRNCHSSDDKRRLAFALYSARK